MLDSAAPTARGQAAALAACHFRLATYVQDALQIQFAEQEGGKVVAAVRLAAAAVPGRGAATGATSRKAGSLALLSLVICGVHLLAGAASLRSLAKRAGMAQVLGTPVRAVNCSLFAGRGRCQGSRGERLGRSKLDGVSTGCASAVAAGCCSPCPSSLCELRCHPSAPWACRPSSCCCWLQQHPAWATTTGVLRVAPPHWSAMPHAVALTQTAPEATCPPSATVSCCSLGAGVVSHMGGGMGLQVKEQRTRLSTALPAACRGGLRRGGTRRGRQQHQPQLDCHPRGRL